MRFTILALSALVAGAIAAPATSAKRHVTHEKRDSLPRNWRRNAKLHPDSTLPMRIALTQSNLDKADEFLMDVSHPTSPNYGKHWTTKQVAEMFAPTKETVAAVADWLFENGVTEFSQSQGFNWLHADVSVGTAERLLQTEYFEYIHESGKSHVACEEYSVPEHLRDHIDFITPTVHFDVKISQPKKRSTDPKPAVQPAKAKSIGSATNNIAAPKYGGKIPSGKVIGELEQCDEYITPDCLRALYLFPPGFPDHPGSEPSPGVVSIPIPFQFVLPFRFPSLLCFLLYVEKIKLTYI
jgi:tripeptidyl-peptidase I